MRDDEWEADTEEDGLDWTKLKKNDGILQKPKATNPKLQCQIHQHKKREGKRDI